MGSLSDQEFGALVARCRQVPSTTNEWLATEFVPTLLETVLDYQQQTTTVQRAMEHFRTEHSDRVRTLDELEGCLARFPDGKEGNVELARYLWGYRLWTRAEQLRGLVAYFGALDVTTLDGLREWARATTFADFEG